MSAALTRLSTLIPDNPNSTPGRKSLYLNLARGQGDTEDAFNQQEKMSEKWRPILGVEAILLSVVSLLSDPNLESPANIDAS
eukprot:1322747-Amorphochlora_amoeboformis.AAC.2